MFRKIGILLGLLEVIDEGIQEELPREETQNEYIERRKIEFEKQTEVVEKKEEEKPKVRGKYVMFKDSEEEKERWKKYFRNLIEGYDRVKGKKFIKQYFIDQNPKCRENFHGFTYGTQELSKIELKINMEQTEELKSLLYSDKNND